MPYDWFGGQNEDDENNQGQTLSQDSSVVTGGGAAGAGGSGTATGKPTSSGSFVNLQKYLDANKDLGFGQQVAGRVGKTVGEGEEAQTQAQGQFQGAVDKGTTKSNQGLLDEAKDDPTKLAGNDDEYNQFVGMRDAKYAGPQQFAQTDYYSPAYEKVQRGTDTANLTKDESGRKTYLNQEYGSGAGRYDYNQGAQRLDNLLIQNDPNARTAFEGVQNRAAQSQGNWDKLGGTLDAYAKQGADQTAATRAASRGVIGLGENGTFNADSPIAQLKNSAQSRADQYNQQAVDQKNALTQAYQSRQLTPEQMQLAGLHSGEQLFGVNPQDYFNQGVGANVNTAATTQEAAKAQALAKLAGQENTYLPYASQAGTYNPNTANTIDSARLANDIAARQSSYNNELNQKNIESNLLGSADIPLGVKVEPYNDSILQAIERQKQAAANSTNTQGSRQAAQEKYNSLLDRLKEMQGRYNYGDTVGGSTPEGSYQSYERYNQPAVAGSQSGAPYRAPTSPGGIAEQTIDDYKRQHGIG